MKNKFILISVLNLIILLIIISIHIDIKRVTAMIQTDNENIETKSTIDNTYYTVKEAVTNSKEFIGQKRLISGYMCTELATNTGLAWITDTKETSKDNAGYLIRLESSDIIEYTSKAIVVYGTLKISENDNALYIDDGQIYNYTGTDKSMLEHNELIDNNIIDVVVNALQYDNTLEITSNLLSLAEIACKYEDETLELILTHIYELVVNKQNINQEQFEIEAEQLWNNFTSQFLGRNIS